jgi:hypothetical protein
VSGSRRRLALSLGAAAIAVGALLAMVFLGTDPPPEIPADRDHVASRSTEACLSCHGPGESAARPPNHPLREDCFTCHVWTRTGQ